MMLRYILLGTCEWRDR